MLNKSVIFIAIIVDDDSLCRIIIEVYSLRFFQKGMNKKTQ